MPPSILKLDKKSSDGNLFNFLNATRPQDLKYVLV